MGSLKSSYSGQPPSKQEISTQNLNKMGHDALRMATVIMDDISRILLNLDNCRVRCIIHEGGKPGFKIISNDGNPSLDPNHFFDLIAATTMPEDVPFYIDRAKREVFFDKISAIPIFLDNFLHQQDTYFVDKTYDLPRICKEKPSQNDPEAILLLARNHYSGRKDLSQYFEKIADEAAHNPLFHFHYSPKDLEHLVETIKSYVQGKGSPKGQSGFYIQ